ncbi:hypothetical protein B0I08_103179 [Glaciihabitans tibetensis]|uniref:Uncharacterized protein n=1 Tax=Glaciihabitans tibetensis TaxID=1266600 RepID=A0A2T0VFK0_9MICO|nr:hypothetical protein [Glaciihabitans tibetensis]PRY68973.1 hypothetical protein B0I08_103179 [Glaciihabitans tibetensis]
MFMNEVAWILAGLGSVVLINVLAVGLVVRGVSRRIRRSRAISGAALRTRARLSWGGQHDVLKLRVRLHDSLVSGRAAVDLALQSGSPRGEVARLFRRIEIEGTTLEAQLRLLESENDPAVLASELTVQRERVDEVSGLVRRLRSAVASGIGELSDDTLKALRSDVDREVRALHAGVQALHSLHEEGNRS